MNDLTHFSLFSGIGGLDLAAEWAGFRTVGQCEFADYPTKVLEKHWPKAPRWRDVRDVTKVSMGREGIGEVTVISGGFPCQPHSLAGKRLASGDERDLWGEFARVICETGPRWVVAENVPGLLSSEHGRFFGRVLRDLARMGYDASWGVLSAFHAGAPHLRKRVCIVAHAVRYGRSCDKFLPQSGLDTERSFSAPEIDTSLLLNNAFRVLSEGDDTDLRGVDGIPRELDELRALGNAVVPHVFYPVFNAIAEFELKRSSISGSPCQDLSVTGMSPNGHCGAAACCKQDANCCLNCDDDCNIRCGWIDTDPEPEN